MYTAVSCSSHLPRHLRLPCWAEFMIELVLAMSVVSPFVSAKGFSGD